MTARLEAAIERLNPKQIEQVTEIIEEMAQEVETTSGGGKPKFKWVGCLSGIAEKDGVEGAKRAIEMRMDLLNKSMPK